MKYILEKSFIRKSLNKLNLLFLFAIMGYFFTKPFQIAICEKGLPREAHMFSIFLDAV